MQSWRVELREEEAGWKWNCTDAAGNFISSSVRSFRRRWEALRDFELMFEDHWSLMRGRFAI